MRGSKLSAPRPDGDAAVIVFAFLLVLRMSDSMRPATFTENINGIPIKFAKFCQVLPHRASHAVDLPCKPAQFGAQQYHAAGVRVREFPNHSGCGDFKWALNHDESEPFFLLARRGTCSFVEKSINAQKLGASGLVIANSAAQEEAVLQKKSPHLWHANLVLIDMYAVDADVPVSLEVFIPVLSVRAQNTTDLLNGRLRISFSNLSRPFGVAMAVNDSLARAGDEQMPPEMLRASAVASVSLGNYEWAEQMLRQALATWPDRSRKAVSALHTLGLVLVRFTDDPKKWEEALALLPGSKRYLTELANGIFWRIKRRDAEGENATLPTRWSADELCDLALQYSEKAVSIGGTDITPRTHYVRVLIWEMTGQNAGAIRKELKHILDLAFRYGDEMTYKLASRMANEYDERERLRQLRSTFTAIVGLMTFGSAFRRRTASMA